jgi:arylsulfatase A-like enzyme
MHSEPAFKYFNLLLTGISCGVCFTLFVLFLSIGKTPLVLNHFIVVFFISLFTYLTISIIIMRVFHQSQFISTFFLFIFINFFPVFFISEPPDEFNFLHPITIKENTIPQKEYFEFSEVKLCLNEDCRKGLIFDKNGEYSYKTVTPKNNYFITSIGVLFTDKKRTKTDISVFIKTPNKKQEVLGNINIKTNRHNWFDVKCNISKWEGQEITILLKINDFETEKRQKHIFLMPPRLIEKNTLHKKKNIILVVIDSFRFDALSLKDGSGHTPLLKKRLDKNGAVFLKNYSQSSWTSPSVASILTSTMPVQTGVVSHQQTFLPGEATSIYKHVSEQGYVTAGVTANGLISSKFNFDQGMDRFIFVDKYYPAFWKSADNVTESSLSWIKNNKDVPFALYMHYMDPHFPYLPPPKYQFSVLYKAGLVDFFAFLPNILDIKSSMNENSKEISELFYKAEVEYWDNSFDHFLTELDKMGLSDNTLIIITGDHGEEFFEHGFGGHASSLYNEVIHVPMIILNGNHIPPQRINQITSNLNIAPTLLTNIGISAPPEMLGDPLYPLSSISSRVNTLHKVAYSELPVNFSYKIGKIFFPNRGYSRAIIYNDYKLIESGFAFHTIDSKEYFNIFMDPKEQNPLTNIDNEFTYFEKQLETYFETLPNKKDILEEGDKNLVLEPKKLLLNLGYLQ